MKRPLLSTILIFGCCVVICGQSSVEEAAKNARDRFSDAKNRSNELERMKREANKRPVSDNSTPGFPLIKEDFEEIQKKSGDLLQITAAASPVNYAAVLKSVSEINRRALRLKSNLFAADREPATAAESSETTISETSDLKFLLNALDKFIDRFVHNSMFQNIKVVNSEDSLDAQRDLEMVIKISFSAKEKTKKLKKEVAKK